MINWKKRLRNKAFLLVFIPFLISSSYQLLSISGVTPKIPETTVTNLLMQFINVLALVGIVIDPTTAGITDNVSRETLTEGTE